MSRVLRFLTLAAGVAGLAAGAWAQPADLKATVDAFVSAHERAIVDELIELVSLPNVSSDTDGTRANAVRLEKMFAARGFSSALLETAGNPLVLAERRVAGATRTLLVYAHYDGQPVDPARWAQPTPFVPVLRDGRLDVGAREVPMSGVARLDPDLRLYARSVSDDKAPIVALLAAIDALQ